MNNDYPHLDLLVDAIESLTGLDKTDVIDDLMRNELRREIANYTLSVCVDSAYEKEAVKYFDENNSED